MALWARHSTVKMGREATRLLALEIVVDPGVDDDEGDDRVQAQPPRR